MTRYILIKEYPGSLEKGTIVHSPHRYNYNNDYKVNNTNNVSNYIFYSKEYIENWPEYWKKL